MEISEENQGKNISSDTRTKFIDEESELDSLIDEMSSGQLLDSTSSTSDALEEELEIYKKEEKQGSTCNVLQYWAEKRIRFPILASLAEVLFGVPGTQVSVERLFSSLTFILNPLRSKLTGDILDDILIIRNNFESFEEMFWNSR